MHENIKTSDYISKLAYQIISFLSISQELDSFFYLSDEFLYKNYRVVYISNCLVSRSTKNIQFMTYKAK